jgi:hypothetical protein
MAVTSASAALGLASCSRSQYRKRVGEFAHLLEELEPLTWHWWLKWNQIV